MKIPERTAVRAVITLNKVRMPLTYASRIGYGFTGRTFADLELVELASRYQSRTDHVRYADLLEID